MKNDIKKYCLVVVNVNRKFLGQTVATKKACSLIHTVSLKCVVLKSMLLIFSFYTVMLKRKTAVFLKEKELEKRMRKKPQSRKNISK